MVGHLLEDRHQGGYEVFEAAGGVDNHGVEETERCSHHTGVFVTDHTTDWGE